VDKQLLYRRTDLRDTVEVRAVSARPDPMQIVRWQRNGTAG